MIGYHGTATAVARGLAAGQVDVTQGGGELGQGFYTGQYIHTAKTWAVGRYGDRRRNVVEFDVPDNEVDALDLQMFSGAEATALRNNIRRHGKTRTYTFDCDMVWAPIVGKPSIVCDQHKWESLDSQALLNGPLVSRRVR